MLKQLKKASVPAAMLALCFWLTGCYYDNEETLYGPAVDCSQTVSRFTADVNPIIQSKCAYSGCHDAGAAGGVNLVGYTQIYQNAARVRGSIFSSKTMPKQGSLTAAEQAKIKCWLDSGAPNN